MAGPLIWNGLNAKALTNDILIDNANFDNLRIGHQLAHNSSSGVESGGVLSVNGGDNTKFDLSAGTGLIINYTTPASPTLQEISWSTFSAQTVIGLASQDETYILINSSGAIVQQGSYPTPAQRRTNIFIGRLGHSSRTVVNFATSFPDFTQSIASQSFDLFDALGPFNVSGNQLANNGANLGFQKSSGVMFFRSFNYPLDNYNPHTVATPAQIPVTFSYRTRTALIAPPVTLIDPLNYDVAGVVTAVPGGANTATIQRVYLAPNGVMQTQYGQATYPNVTAAVAAIGTEAFIQNPALTNVSVLVGYIVVQKNCTSLADTSTSAILRAPKFETGVGGGVNTVTTLQQTYNSSSSPEIVLNTTNGALSINDASVPLGTDLFNVNNNAGSTTFFKVNAAGITTTNIIDTALTPSQAVVTNGANQLISLAYAFPPNGSSLVIRDPNGNGTFNNAVNNITVTVTANQTIALNAGSAQRQRATGAANIQYNLPDATTLLSGWSFYINNASTGVVTVNQQNGTTTVVTLPAGAIALVVCTNNSTVQGTWNYSSLLTPGASSGTAGTSVPGFLSSNALNLNGSTSGTVSVLPQAAAGTFNFNLPTSAGTSGQVLTSQGGGAAAMIWSDLVAAGVSPTVQKFLSGSGTYTTPAGVEYIRVRMVGGGGGGSGSGTVAGTAAGTGGNTTFGSSLLSALGGGPGVFNAQGGAGGTASLGTGPIGTALTGGRGNGFGYVGASANNGIAGGTGGTSAFGGGGAGGSGAAPGLAASPNTGAGGGGAGANGNNVAAGPGGGSGGFVDAIITNPAASYAYSVGTAGTAGGAGTSGSAGSIGGSGYIEVTEYYSSLAVSATVPVAAGTYFGGPYSGVAATPTFKTFQPPTVQKFLSGSGTYTTPAGALYLRVRAIGGGGGGGGSTTIAGTYGAAAGAGGNTTFGTTLIVANGGGGANNGVNGTSPGTSGTGGTASLGVAVGLAIPGGAGVSGQQTGASTNGTGGAGGSSVFGGAGIGAVVTGAGIAQPGGAGVANTGGGGGGASLGSNVFTGAGGATGGYVDGIIYTPAASYPYAVGVAGTAGAAGTSGAAGGAGGSGVIIVEEHYQ